MSDFDKEPEQEQEKLRPSHRVSFARVNGVDQHGNDVLGRAMEIGQIWPRRGKDGQSILRLDHIPEELRSRNGGVLFVNAIERPEADKAAGEKDKDRAPGKNKARDKGFDRDR